MAVVPMVFFKRARHHVIEDKSIGVVR